MNIHDLGTGRCLWLTTVACRPGGQWPQATGLVTHSRLESDSLPPEHAAARKLQVHAVMFVVGRGCVYCISLVNRFNGCLQKLNCNIFIRVSKLTGYVNVSQDQRVRSRQ